LPFVRWALLFTVLVIAAAVSNSGHASANRIVISQTGRIGSLRMGQSGAPDVIAYLGGPAAERRGAEPGGPSFRALGYGCFDKPQDAAFPLLETAKGRVGPYCKTVFWINRRTEKLGDFYTSSSRYSESHGVRLGMKTADAERLLRRRVYVGCGENVYLATPRARLTIAFAGGVARKMRGSSALHLIGGHVYAFAAHARNSDVGIFDCL
jgi:hypothetical protein